MTTLGKYELHELLGKGGFGTVYRAIDTSLNREVALKVLHPQLTTDSDFLESFKQEARLAASVENLHIVTIYECGEQDGRVFIAMRYLPGGSLKQRLEKIGPIPFLEALKIVNQVCSGLQAAHEQGLIHRDIKPANILFDKSGQAVVGDFGLARAVQLSSSSAASGKGGAGTPAYRAPELWRGEPPASPATDIYSLGCVLFEMLTGKVLFDGATPDVVLTQHLIDGPHLPGSFSDEIPRGFRQIIKKALEKDPHKRFQTVQEFEKVLNGLAEKPVHQVSIPWKLMIGGLFGVLGIIGIAAFIFPLSGKPSSIKQTEPPTQFFTQTLIPTSTVTTMPTSTITPRPTSTNTSIPSSTSTPASTPTLELGIGSSRIREKDGMTMVYVPAGPFVMGNDSGNIDEKPAHEVDLKAFWIDQTEVTNGMYKKCVAEGACPALSNIRSMTQEKYFDNIAFANFPVLIWHWEDAEKYCKWNDGRLPSEAEWEKAAKGTDNRKYPWGNEQGKYFWANYYDHFGDTVKVASFNVQSFYGTYDMAGNVWELTSDIYEPYPGGDPNGSIFYGRGFHVRRGGSWNSTDGREIQTTDRGVYNISNEGYFTGFRCVLDVFPSQ